MKKLIIKDLVSSKRLWGGAFLILLVTSVILTAVAYCFSVAIRSNLAGGLSDRDFEGFMGAVFAPALLCFVTALITINQSVTMSVRARLEVYGLWQSIGVLPKQIKKIILLQLLIVAAIAGGIGFFPGIFLGGIAFEVLSAKEKTVILENLETPGWETCMVFLILVVAVLLGGINAASIASKQDIVVSAPEAESKAARITWKRWLGALLLTVGIVALVINARRDASFDSIGNLAVVIIILTPLIFVALAPGIVKNLLRIWTMPLQFTAWSWFLGRRFALHRASATTLIVSPLAFVVGIVGGYSGFYETIKGSLLNVGMMLPEQSYFVLAIIFGAPILLLIISVATGIIMTSSGREAEYNKLMLYGASARGIFLAGLYEVFMYIVTAVIIGSLTILVVLFASWWVITGMLGQAVVAFDLEPVFYVTVAGAVFVAFTALLPVAYYLIRHAKN